MTSSNKTKYKIKKGYEKSSGDYGHNLADLVFEKRFEVKRVKRVLKKKKYTETDKFLKLKDEYLRNDDELFRVVK